MDRPRSFNGNTWVAFADLCGTKSMYRDSPERAERALDRFYSAAYDLVHENGQVNGIAVTDCAVLWLTGSSDHNVVSPGSLEGLLDLLKSLHQRLLQRCHLVRSTVAYGRFKYEQRIQLPRLIKGMAIGNAYLDAYAQNDRYKPGSIMIVKAPDGLNPNDFAGQLAPCLRPRGNDGPWEFIWWVEGSHEISEALCRRDKAYNDRFAGLVSSYKIPRCGR